LTVGPKDRVQSARFFAAVRNALFEMNFVCLQIYTTNLNKLYDKEVKDFMESVKTNMVTRTDRKGI
jgi:hypothetical protein